MCIDLLHKSSLSDNKIIFWLIQLFFFLKNDMCRAINLEHFVYASEVILLSYLSLLV